MTLRERGFYPADDVQPTRPESSKNLSCSCRTRRTFSRPGGERQREGGALARPRPPRDLLLPGKRYPAAHCQGRAAAMRTATDNKGYFQRGSLFWFTIITLSFGYYTVKAAKGARAPFNARSGPARTGCAGATLHPGALGWGRLDSGKRHRRTGLPAPLADAGGPEKPATQAFLVWGREQVLSPPHSSVSTSFKMVVTKSEAGKAATAYFRTARPVPSLVTIFGLGYFTVRSREGRGICLDPPGSRRARGSLGALSCACAGSGCQGYCSKRKFNSLISHFLLYRGFLPLWLLHGDCVLPQSQNSRGSL